MASQLQPLIDEAKNPRNMFRGDDPADNVHNYDAMMRNYKYLTTADITFMVKMEGDVIQKVRWFGSGSIYSIAYASYLAGMVGGMSVNEVQAITIADVEARYGIKWPRLYQKFKIPAENALMNTLSTFQRGQPI